jgi:hypothetical protein
VDYTWLTFFEKKSKQKSNMSLVGDVSAFLNSDTGQTVVKATQQLGNNILVKQANGINYAAPAVTPNGNISVPTSQSGNGVFAGLPNILSKYLGPAVDKVVSNVAASIGGNPVIASGGGVGVVGPQQTMGPAVTQNTTYDYTGGYSSSSSSGSTTTSSPGVVGWLLIGAAIYGLLKILKVIK